MFLVYVQKTSTVKNLSLPFIFSSSPDYPDLLFTNCIEFRNYMSSLWNKRRVLRAWHLTFPLRKIYELCMYNIQRRRALWWRAGSRNCQICEQYTPLFFSFHFFSHRGNGGVNDFPTRTQQYSLASPFFPHFDTCQFVLRTMDRMLCEARGKEKATQRRR